MDEGNLILIYARAGVVGVQKKIKNFFYLIDYQLVTYEKK